MSTNAVTDTSFLIDWARYTKRDLLFSIFRVSIPESVLGEVKSENTISWIAQKLAEESMYLFTETTPPPQKKKVLCLPEFFIKISYC